MRMTLRWLVLLVVCGVAPVAARAQTPLPTISVSYRQFTLPNGLTVILHQDRKVPVVAVNIWYHVGSANERPGRTGFAHLFEHLMFEGSGHVKEGEFVHKGDLLLKIKPDFYEAALNQSKASFQSSLASKTTSEANLERAEADYKRMDPNRAQEDAPKKRKATK